MHARTGGQYCVSGIVLQLLAGLDRGLRLTVDSARVEEGRLTSVVMVLEPDAGGDHAVSAQGVRWVEQVKIRTTGKPWTAGEIAAEVLPDLVKAVSGVPEFETRYRFLTDGALNCPGLLALAASLRGRPCPVDPLSALDADDRRAFLYGRWMSQRGYFEALARRAGIDDLSRFWRLLAAFEAEGGLTGDELDARIDAVLEHVVDAGEDIAAKRHELFSRIARLAQDGGSIEAGTLLAQAGLPAERLLHRARLPRIVQDRLARDLAGLGYDAAHDVREAPRAPGGGFLLISGQSGLGKSWRLAALLAAESAAGRLALLVAHAQTLGDIRDAIVERIWLSGFDRPVDLPSLQRRLGSSFAGRDGIWLTVGVDDIQDRALLAALHAADWRQYGIRIAATVPVQLADELARAPRSPADQRVERFSRSQLHRFLAGHGLHGKALPDDVADLLTTPIFADLYRRSFAPDWQPSNEYELVDRYWHHATFMSGGMADHQDDVLALECAARGLLDPAGVYPWTHERAAAAGLVADARARLVRTGVLRQDAAGVSLVHDRVLNWLVARALLSDLRAARLSAGEVAALVAAFGTAEAIAPALGHRLGYVLLDLFWLAARALAPGQVAALVDGVLWTPANRTYAARFIAEDLAGIGPAMLPALEVIAARPDDDLHGSGASAAKAIAAIGRGHPAAAQPVVMRLLDMGGLATERGLVAARRLAIPQAVELLWSTHRARRRATAQAIADTPDSDRYRLFEAARASGDALSRALGGKIDWLTGKLARVADPVDAEALLDLLLEAEHGLARGVWNDCKHRLLALVTDERGVLTRAIARFADRDDAARLERDGPVTDWMADGRRFGALLRLAPDRAIARIATMPREAIVHGPFSMARLVRTGGPEAQARILSRLGTGWQAMRDLVLAYADAPDLIDVPSFEAVIAGLESRLAELAETDWTPAGEGHLIRFLAKARRPDLLAILRARRGSSFELLVRDLAIAREGRTSPTVDREGTDLERLLLLIGGEGYGAYVAHALRRRSVFAREDGYRAALRLPPGSGHAVGLADAAAATHRDDRETYGLMHALAAHRMDEPLVSLVMSSVAVSHDAIDIRRSLGPLDADMEARMRSDLASAQGGLRAGAACALALSPPADAAELLADALARGSPHDPTTLTIVRIAAHIGCYDPRMLEPLECLLESADGAAREAVLPYLAATGDPRAHAAVAAQLERESVPVIDHCALRTAFALSTGEPDGGPGTERLRLFLDRHHGFYPLGLIAARLHRNKAITGDELVELAYAARRISPDTSARLIDAVAGFDEREARAIAEHHFARAPTRESASRVLLLGGPAGLELVLDAYLARPPHAIRWMIARALRCDAERSALLAALGSWASGASSDRRRAAAELLGWLPGAPAEEILNRLIHDREPEVADAALASLAVRDGEAHASVLIAELADADELGRWARLGAITALADPWLLQSGADELAFGDAIRPLGETFAIGAERAIVERKKKLERDAARKDRDERP